MPFYFFEPSPCIVPEGNRLYRLIEFINLGSVYVSTALSGSIFIGTIHFQPHLYEMRGSITAYKTSTTKFIKIKIMEYITTVPMMSV